MLPKPLLILLSLPLALSSCQAVPAAPAIPTPVIWQVTVSPGLGFLAPAMSQCLVSLPGYSLDFREDPQIPVSPSNNELLFQWGEPSGLTSPSFKLGENHLVFVIHPDNPVAKLDLETLQAVFRGEVTTWAEVCSDCQQTPMGEIQLWTYSQSQDIQAIFSSHILTDDQISTAAFLAASPLEVLNAIADSPSAIGYIPSGWSDESKLKILTLSDQSTDWLTFPILAILPSEPNADQARWLNCLSQSIP